MSNRSSTILGILAGTAIGAVAGILFAPDKGSNTRRKLVEQTNAAADTMAERVAHLKDQIVDTVAMGKMKLEDKVESIITDASYKTDDIITTLEGKLKKLKVKNKELQDSKS